MKHRWFSAAAGVSFLLFVLAGAACIRGQFATNGWGSSRVTIDRGGAAEEGTAEWRATVEGAWFNIEREGLLMGWDRNVLWGAWPVDPAERSHSESGFFFGASAPTSHTSWSGVRWHGGWRGRVGPDCVHDGPVRWERGTGANLLGRIDEAENIWIPYWWLLGLTGILPALWVRRWRRERRRARVGCCRRCGYDLRGNPAAAACPECGTPVGRQARAGGGWDQWS